MTSLPEAPSVAPPDAERLVRAIAERITAQPGGRVTSHALVGRSESSTYADVWSRAGGLAAELAQLPPGPAVVLAEDVLDVLPAYWGCLRSGRTVVAMGGAARAALAGRRRAWDRAAALNPKVVLSTPDFASLAADLPGASTLDLSGARPSDDADAFIDAGFNEPACLVQTSGSTGVPRFAGLSASAVLARGLRVDVSPTTAVSGFGLDTISILQPLMAGPRHWVHVAPARAFGEPLSMLEAVEANEADGLVMSTSLARLIIERASTGRWDLSSLTWVSWGLEPIHASTVRTLCELLLDNGARELRVKRGYGTTESGLIAAGESDASDVLPSDVGVVIDGRDARVVDGVVQIKRYPGMFSGYVGEPEETPDGFTDDGWWSTGDRGTVENRVVTLTGRAKDILITNGAKYSLAEIEAAVEASHPDIRAFACGVADVSAEEALGLALVAAEPVEQSVRTLVAKEFGITAHTVVRLSWDQIPFASNGKIQRAELAVLLRARPDRPVTVADQAGRDTSVAAIWRRVLQLTDPLDRSARFNELGGTSLQAAELFAALETDVGARVSLADFFAEPTLANLEKIALAGGVRTRGQAEETRADELLRLQLTHVGTWPGTRPTEDPLLVGLNLDGSRAPLVWVFQGAAEFRALANALGPDQPLYGLRSGHTLMRYDEDDIQVFALRYARAVEQACATGPIYLGGNCQGAVIALAVAQHLIRRGRTVPLLSLLDWSTHLQPYTGKVLILHGESEHHRVRYLQNSTGRQDGHRLFDRAIKHSLPAGHGQYFQPGNVERLAHVLTQHMHGKPARRRSPRTLLALPRRTRP